MVVFGGIFGTKLRVWPGLFLFVIFAPPPFPRLFSSFPLLLFYAYYLQLAELIIGFVLPVERVFHAMHRFLLGP